MSRFVLRTVAASSTFFASYLYITHERRPYSTICDPEMYHSDHQLRSPSSSSNTDRKATFRSFREDSLSSSFMRSFTLSAVTGLCRAYLSTCQVNIKGLNEFHDILEKSWSVEDDTKDDINGRPILTVCNHMSTIDDPIIISRIAPTCAYTSHPNRHRWGGCSEEICFKSSLLASFFGSGKVLPIWRGGGIGQEMFQELSAHLVPGNWVHLFPEGCICQKNLNRSDVSSNSLRISFFINTIKVIRK